MTSSSQPTATARLIAPLHSSLQRCNPRLRRRRRIVEFSLVLLSLIQDLQQHRVLSGALLVRKDQLRDDRAAVAEKLGRSMNEVSQHFASKSFALNPDDWLSLRARWDSLGNNWQELDFHTNLEVHGELVMSMVAILRCLAHGHEDDLATTRRRVLSEWPTLIEHLGMLRALGLYVLAQPGALSDASVGRSLGTSLHETRSTLACTSDMPEARPMIAVSDVAVGYVIALRAGQAAFESTDYMRVMTSTIDGWYRLTRMRLRAEPAFE